MRKLNLFATFILFSVIFSSCLNDDVEGDKEKIVEMKIYAETGYGASVLSNVLTEPLQFSDNDGVAKAMLLDIITEGFDFDYQRGYEYIIKAKKVWMKEPPQDVSTIKYVFIELLSKTKVITEDSEKNVELYVASKTVKFAPRYPSEYEEIEGQQTLKIYDALRAKENGKMGWIVLREIEGFNFESGYEYLLDAKKIIKSDPYSVRYVLLNIVSKKEKTE